MPNIQIMEGTPRERFVGEFRDPEKGYFIPDLPEDANARKWRQLVSDFHRSHIKGRGQTIAVIDSGFDENHPAFKGSVSGHLDLTGEGIQDASGHGTLVSLLCLAVAPEAKLFHLKIMRKNGYCVGDSEQAQTEIMAKAIREAAKNGATIINISGGRYREGLQGETILDSLRTKCLTNVCDCEVCFAAEETAREFNIPIFVAAGNEGWLPWKWAIRLLRSLRLAALAQKMEDGQLLRARRVCPASAAEVTPVMGVVGGRAIAEISHSQANGIEAVASIKFSGRHGSSFAVPLASGTAALVAQVLSPHRPKRGKNSIDGRNALFKRNHRAEMCYLFDLQSLFWRPDDPDPVTCPNLAELYKAMSMPERAEPLFLQALSVYMQGSRFSAGAHKVYSSLQDIYLEASDSKRVKDLQTRWFDYVLRTGDNDELETTAKVFEELGVAYLNTQKLPEAQGAFSTSVKFLRKSLGPNHPQLGQRLLDLAGACLRNKDFSAAAIALRHAISIFGNTESRELALTLDYLGLVNHDCGKAEACFQKALAIYEKLGIENTPDAAVTMRNYAGLLQYLKRDKESESLLFRAAKIEGAK